MDRPDRVHHLLDPAAVLNGHETTYHAIVDFTEKVPEKQPGSTLGAARY